MHGKLSRASACITFVVACAFTWVNLIKSQEKEAGDLFDNDKVYYFVFVADYRHRLEVKLPATYFGNCLAICHVPAKKSELLGENGIIMAARAIGKKVKELESGVLVGAEKYIYIGLIFFINDTVIY